MSVEHGGIMISTWSTALLKGKKIRNYPAPPPIIPPRNTFIRFRTRG
jgi:hypothetical protein